MNLQLLGTAALLDLLDALNSGDLATLNGVHRPIAQFMLDGALLLERGWIDSFQVVTSAETESSMTFGYTVRVTPRGQRALDARARREPGAPP